MRIPRSKVSKLWSCPGLPKLHQKHSCEETEANYLDWQVHFCFLASITLIGCRRQGMGGGNSEEELMGNQIPEKFDFFSHHPWR